MLLPNVKQFTRAVLSVDICSIHDLKLSLSTQLSLQISLRTCWRATLWWKRAAMFWLNASLRCLRVERSPGAKATTPSEKAAGSHLILLSCHYSSLQSLAHIFAVCFYLSSYKIAAFKVWSRKSQQGCGMRTRHRGHAPDPVVDIMSLSNHFCYSQQQSTVADFGHSSLPLASRRGSQRNSMSQHVSAKGCEDMSLVGFAFRF